MSFRSQLTFKGLVDCKEFIPNAFKKIRCMACGHDIDQHHSEAVQDEFISVAIESAQKDQPATLIIESKGKLYLGGFIASGEKYVKDNNITRVVNCALGLEKMYIAWGKQIINIEKTMPQVKFLRLGWMDDHNQQIFKYKPYDQIEESIKFIKEGLDNGENVVVHCAQGKSRSGTIVVAYIMAMNDCTYEEALKFAQSKRTITQPNDSFAGQLKEMEIRGLKDLRKIFQ